MEPQTNHLKGLVITLGIALPVLLIAGVGGTWYVMGQKSAKEKDSLEKRIAELEKNAEEKPAATPTPTPDPSTGNAKTETDATAINNIIKTFTDNIQYTGGSKLSQDAVNTMKNLMTQSYRQKLSENYQGSFALLLGIQDFPDQGYFRGLPTINGSTATANVEFRYSSGLNPQKKFYLVKTNGNWLINNIAKL